MIDSIFEIINKRAMPGVLIFDPAFTLLYYNSEAAEILSSLQPQPSRQERGPSIPEAVTALCQRLRERSGFPPLSRCAVTEERSGSLELVQGGQVSLRASYLGPGGEGEPPHILVLIERISEKREVDLERVAKEYRLSRKELEVLHNISRGLSNRKIAERMFISEYTVKNHVKNIMKRMGVASRSEILATLR